MSIMEQKMQEMYEGAEHAQEQLFISGVGKCNELLKDKEKLNFKDWLEDNGYTEFGIDFIKDDHITSEETALFLYDRYLQNL